MSGDWRDASEREELNVTCPDCGSEFTTDVLPWQELATVECPCCNIESEYDLRCFR